MIQDRWQHARIPITHRSTAWALGVRRSSITASMQNLAKLGALKADRGVIEIVDREALMHAAGGCYVTARSNQ
jgi:hypothetical protein